MDNIDNGFVVFIQAIQDSINKILMVKRFPKSCKLIGSTLDEVHVFGDGLGTLDDSLELVLDLFDMPMRWTSICVGMPIRWTSICVSKGEPCVIRGCGLLNKRD